MTSLLIHNAQIVASHQTYLGACLTQDGLISVIFDEPFPKEVKSHTKIDAAGSYLAPGLIDLQLNGAFGYDFTQTPETIWPVAARLPELGLTGFVDSLS